jgi:hypothetical protein
MSFTIADFLEHLDGSGLVLTDDELIDEALKEFGITQNTILSVSVIQ